MASALESTESWLAVVWWVKTAAAGLVLLALVMQFGADWIARPLEKSVADARKLEITRLTTEAARLSAEAETAKGEIAESNERAAEANARAEEAKLALEKIKMPRTLPPERQQFVADVTAPFSGQRYRVTISSGADDGLAFWESLYVTLNKAGWIYLPAMPPSVGNPPAGIPIAAMPGVEIRFDPAKESDELAPALALGNALHVDGMVVAVNRDTHSNPNEAERDILLIAIGARVSPP